MLDPRAHDTTRFRAAVQALALGMCSSALYWMFYRVFTAKFPLNFISPAYATIPLFGVPLGLVLARKLPTLSRGAAIALGAGLALFAVSALAYKDKSVHYLLFGAYYDYPAPTSGWVTRGLIASVPLGIVPLVITSRSFALLPAQWRMFSTPAAFVGIGLGVLGAELATPVLGAYTILVGAAAVCAAFVPGWRVALPTAALVVTAGVVMAHPAEAIFTWQLREYKRLDTYWTHHYKADWIEFDGGHCLGGVRNEIMIGYSCDTPDKIPLTHVQMARAISNGDIRRTRVASIGRPDGVIAMAHKAKNPNLERFVAVENDAPIVRDMLSRFARYQGNIFTTDKGIELVASDNRLWIENTREKFDAMYIDGVGLMLVPFPFTVIEQENYLFSADAYRRIFNEILTPDGVLIIDRGTTSTGESQDLAAAFPPGIQVRTLYTKIPTYPLTGLPLVYVLASRNGAELDRISRELVKGNLYAQDPFDYREARRRWASDDRPMFQPSSILAMYGVMAPFALITLAFVRSQLRKHVGAWARRDVGLQVLLGILFAVTTIWLTARGARAFLAGTQMGWCACFGTMLIGVAGGLAAAWGRPMRRCFLAAGVACAVAFALLLLVPLAPWAALIGALSGGVGLGAMAAVARGSSSAPEGFEPALGVLVGIFVFQAGLALAGFALLAICVLAVLALLFVRARSPQMAADPVAAE